MIVKGKKHISYNIQVNSYSSGIIQKIWNHNIRHLCPIKKGFSGSPILSFLNLKVIGIHKEGTIFKDIGAKNENNKKYTIDSFIKGNNTNEIKKEKIKDKKIK